MTTSTPSIDPLTLLVHKIAPNQFDLSLGFSYISLRDQMVRASMVVKSLVEHGLVQQATTKDAAEIGLNKRGRGSVEVIIFGGGAAGVAAAMEAEAQNLTFALIEKGPRIPGGVLTSTAPRFVSVGMYEWPNQSSQSHAFPAGSPKHSLPLNCNAPLTIADFAKEVVKVVQPHLDQWLKNAHDRDIAGTIKRFAYAKTRLTTASKNQLAGMLQKSFDLQPSTSVAPLKVKVRRNGSVYDLNCKVIIYAVGFERESQLICTDPVPVRHRHNPPFWTPDTFDKTKKNESVLIIGSGDGALQDTFRFCIKRTPASMEPLGAWDELERLTQSYVAYGQRAEFANFLAIGKARLAEAEMYTTGHNMWHAQSDANHQLDEVVRKQVDEWLNHGSYGQLLRQALASMQRKGIDSVTLIRRPRQKPCFDKCYLLNRTWAWMLHEVGAFTLFSGTVSGFVEASSTLHPHAGKVTSGDAQEELTYRSLAAAPAKSFPGPLYDIVILRAGLTKADEKGQHVGIIPAQVTRLDLTRIPPPLRP